MNPNGLLSDQDFQLIKGTQEFLLQFRNEPRTSFASKIERGHDDDLVEVNLSTALPHASKRKIALLCGDAPKSLEELPFKVIEHVTREISPFVI
jgi:hypothetical protein